MNELNEISGKGGGSVSGAIRPLGSAARYVAPEVARGMAGARSFGPVDDVQSDGGFNFSGIDSLGAAVKGFVQTEEAALAANELERAGISVQNISERRGPRKKNRRPTSIEFATLAEQFGDLMEVGESPTQVCRLLAFAQTNR
ncbi:MAG: hypothetical protein ABJB34_02250, partial [Acidobacteriota bacterium]